MDKATKGGIAPFGQKAAGAVTRPLLNRPAGISIEWREKKLPKQKKARINPRRFAGKIDL